MIDFYKYSSMSLKNRIIFSVLLLISLVYILFASFLTVKMGGYESYLCGAYLLAALFLIQTIIICIRIYREIENKKLRNSYIYWSICTGIFQLIYIWYLEEKHNAKK